MLLLTFTFNFTLLYIQDCSNISFERTKVFFFFFGVFLLWILQSKEKDIGCVNGICVSYKVVSTDVWQWRSLSKSQRTTHKICRISVHNKHSFTEHWMSILFTPLVDYPISYNVYVRSPRTFRWHHEQGKKQRYERQPIPSPLTPPPVYIDKVKEKEPMDDQVMIMININGLVINVSVCFPSSSWSERVEYFVSSFFSFYQRSI